MSQTVFLWYKQRAIYSKEVGGFFDINIDKGTLTAISNEVKQGFEFNPVYKDTFQRGGVRFHFLRDKRGKVTAIAYSNPVVRNVKFVKLNDDLKHKQNFLLFKKHPSY